MIWELRPGIWVEVGKCGRCAGIGQCLTSV